MNTTDKAAKTLWEYHVLDQKVVKSDCILALGNSDTRTAERASELYIEGYGDYLITTGGLGRLTKEVFNKPEAQIFADIAIKNGVPKDKIIIEDKSTNTFDNLRFTRNYLDHRNIVSNSFLVVTKPYMERRAYAMFRHIWPDKSITVASPDLRFETYPTDTIPKKLVINMLVGDLQRLIVYGKRGDLVKQDIPDDVMTAYHLLIDNGFNEQLIDVSQLPPSS